MAEVLDGVIVALPPASGWVAGVNPEDERSDTTALAPASPAWCEQRAHERVTILSETVGDAIISSF